jgi:hypothetical protein
VAVAGAVAAMLDAATAATTTAEIDLRQDALPPKPTLI